MPDLLNTGVWQALQELQRAQREKDRNNVYRMYDNSPTMRFGNIQFTEPKLNYIKKDQYPKVEPRVNVELDALKEELVKPKESEKDLREKQEPDSEKVNYPGSKPEAPSGEAKFPGLKEMLDDLASGAATIISSEKKPESESEPKPKSELESKGWQPGTVVPVSLLPTTAEETLSDYYKNLSPSDLNREQIGLTLADGSPKQLGEVLDDLIANNTGLFNRYKKLSPSELSREQSGLTLVNDAPRQLNEAMDKILSEIRKSKMPPPSNLPIDFLAPENEKLKNLYDVVPPEDIVMAEDTVLAMGLTPDQQAQMMATILETISEAVA